MMTPYQRFQQFHEENPDIYERLKALALHARTRGKARLGIRLLWERMRWDLTVETYDANSDYKLNDHYTRFYARLLMAQEPALEGLFEIRERSDNEEAA